MNRLQQFFKEMNNRRVKTNLIFIVAAAVVLVLISGFQYYYSRHLLGIELEEDTERELAQKEAFLYSYRNMCENSLVNHIWDLEHYLAMPDSMYDVAEWILRLNPQLACAGIAFTPYFYPEKGRLFEPYALRKDDEIVFKQLGGKEHDYTQGQIYQWVMENDRDYWSEPYFDSLVKPRDLITYCFPIHGNKSQIIAILGLDIETRVLGDTLNSGNRYPSSYVLLLDEDSDLIVGPKEEILPKVCVENVAKVICDDKIPAKTTINNKCYFKQFRDPDDGYKGHVFYCQMTGSKKWTIAMVCYDDEVFGPLLHMRRIVSLLMLLAMVVLTFIILRFVRNDIRLEKAHAEQERISTELHVANEIQQSMLPHQQLYLEDADIYGLLVPAREVGGDLYDYFARDEKLFFCIGDVSGKGAPSAMLMAVTHSLFRAFSAHENNPARIMYALNEASCQNNEKNMFVTLFIGVLDLPTGRLRYCNAGHDKPFVFENDKPQVVSLECDANLPIGALENTLFTAQETVLTAGSTIFLYTDGLSEAMNSKHLQFGLKRVEETMKTCARKNLHPKEVVDEVRSQVRAFVAGEEQNDDLTMLVIHYTPTRFDSTVSETLVIKNDVHELTRFSTFIKTVAEQMKIEPSLAGQLRLAVEEAVVNVIDYAYPTTTEGKITISMQSDGKILRFIISDSGVPFDPTAKEKADTTLAAEDRQIGGLGILLYRELMDSINYERTNGKNILTLTKKL